MLLTPLAAHASPPPEAPGLDPGKAITQLGLDTWTTDQGLPSASVISALATRDGWVWLGTYDGLARFDGSVFTVFTQADGLGNNGVRALCEDREGGLWIGTNGGGVARLHRGRFRRFTAADGLPSEIVWSLLTDVRDGSVWIGTNGGGLVRFHDGKFRRYDVAASGRSIADLAQEPDGTLWIAADVQGLRRLSPDGGFRTYGVEDGLPHGLVSGVAVGRGGAVWGATAGGLVLVRDERVAPLPEGLEPLRGALLARVVEDGRGTLWVGTNGQGLARFARGEVTFLGPDEGVGDAVRALHADRHGRLWVGTNGGGVSRLRDGAFTAFTTNEGLARDFAYTTFEDRKGTLWAGTAGGLDRLDGARFARVTLPLARPVAVRSVMEGPDGALWVGTYGAGVARLLDGRWTTWNVRDGLANDAVRAVLVDRAGRTWAATNGGLSVLEKGVVRSWGVADGLPSSSLIGLAEDGRGDLWVGTNGAGLVRLSGGRFRSFTTRDGLASDVVLGLFVDSGGTLWAATNGGLSRLTGERFRSFAAAAGLPSDSVMQVAEDARGDIWVGTSRGVARLSRASLDAATKDPAARLEVEPFEQADGLKSVQCPAPGQPGATRARDGRLWFSTTRGVATIDPARPRGAAPPPSVAIEEVFLDGRPVDFWDGVIAPPGTWRIEVQFARLSAGPARGSAVRFRLVGYDREWVDAGDRRRAEYTRVPPGSYTFRVASRAGSAEWREAGPAVTLRVRPRFYQTRAFAFAAAALVIGFLGAGHRLRVRALAAREKQLGALVDERTRSLVAEKARAEAAHAEAANLLVQREKVEAELRRQGSQLASLHETALAIMDRREPEQLLQDLVERAATFLGTPFGFLYLRTADGASLQRRVWVGACPRDEFVRPGEGAVGKAYESGAVLAVEDYDAWPGRLAEAPPGVFGAVLTVPLRLGGEVEGVLGVVHGRDGRRFSPAETRFLQSLAELASLALDNARLFERERAARETAERLEAAARALSSTVDRQRVAELILVELEKVVPCDAVAVQELRDGQLEVVAARGFAAEALGRRFDASAGDGRSREVLEGRRPVILQAASPRSDAAAPGSPDRRSWMGVPLLFGDRVLGMLSLNRAEGGAYGPADAESAAAFAAQAAVAIENVRLFEALRDELAEHERARRELAESELRFRQLAENVDAAFFVRSVDPDALLYMSPGFGRIWGRPVPSTWEELVASIEPSDRERLVVSCENAGAGHDLECQVLRADGSARWVRIRAFPVPDEEGRIRRVAGIIEDVSERKAVEQMRDELVRTLVHDLRNPLTSMLASMDVLEAGLSSAECRPNAEALRIARRGGAKLRGLVDAILEVARLEQGKVPLALRPVDLRPATEEALDLQRPLAEARRLRIVNEVPEGLPPALADDDLLSRILQNLVGNAVKFSPAEGTIRVGAAREGPGDLRITVADEGPGFPPAIRDRAFERFVTGRHAASGSGLGLAFCRLAVEAQGGRIFIESAPAGGALVSFTLPVADASAS